MRHHCDKEGQTARLQAGREQGLLGKWLLHWLAAALFLTSSHHAVADDIPPSRQVLIVMRALAYDGNLKSRAGETINVAVMHRKGHGGSEQMANAMTEAFAGLQSTLVAGLPMVVTHIIYNGPDGLKKAISGAGIDVLYVCDGLDADIDAIKSTTRPARVLSVGAKQEYIERGLSFGVFNIDGKSTILLNLQASRLESVSFGSDLLRLAKVIR